jgi:hypothetical protein
MLPAVSSALDASRGKVVRTTDAAMVSGASVVSSSSGILSSWVDMLCKESRVIPRRSRGCVCRGNCAKDKSIIVSRGSLRREVVVKTSQLQGVVEDEAKEEVACVNACLANHSSAHPTTSLSNTFACSC